MGLSEGLAELRPELVFNDKVISTPDASIYRLVAFLSYWKKLLSTKNLQQVEEMIGEIRQACGLDT